MIRLRRPPNPAAWAYALAWIATLAQQFLRMPGAGTVAAVAIVVFLVMEFPRQRRYAQVVFVALTAAGMVGVAMSAHPLALFLAGWERGAAYAAFFLALSTLRDAAETSPLVRRSGQHLVEQPDGRRYLALTAGGHLFGIILSYGAVELLAAMVIRANARLRGATEAQRQDRARRMLLAIYRGFCVMNCWNPLNLMTAIVSTAVPAAPMRMLMPAAFAVSVVMTLIGWLDDRRTGAVAGSAPPAVRGGWAIHLRIIALIAAVMAACELTSLWLGVPLVAAVTLTVPLAALAWVATQAGRFVPARAGRSSIPAVIARRAGRFLWRIPGFRGEATVLASAGFMGVTLGAALPALGLASWLGQLPGITLPLLVPVILIATGQIGLNPVAVVALIGAAVPDPAAVGIPPSALAFSCMLGWGLAVSLTPMSASALITARWAQASPWTVTTVWNAAYGAVALLLVWAAIWAMWAW